MTPAPRFLPNTETSVPILVRYALVLCFGSLVGMGCGPASAPSSTGKVAGGGPAPGQSQPEIPDDRPRLVVTPDGFPAGHDTPEGAACDLARAFIERDAETIRAEAVRAEASPGGPKAIGKVFAARRLSRNGPASYGYAAFGFQDVMFVDVGAFLHDGNRALNRTLVIRDKDGKWYVHPLPDASPLLSAGLNDEAASEKDFSDSYEIQR